MIKNNASSIFNGTAMGVKYDEYDNPIDEYKEKSNFNSLQSINFEDKVMGGHRSSIFLDGKLPSITGHQMYSMRVNQLTGKGKMTYNMTNLYFNSNKKDNSMFKVNNMLNLKSTKKTDYNKFNMLNGMPNSNINMTKFNMLNGNQNLNLTKNTKDNAVNKINMILNGVSTSNKKPSPISTVMKMLDNPERVALNRIKQQKNISMFGDFDGDKLINVLDCNPLDKFKQGEMHNALYDMYGNTPDSEILPDNSSEKLNEYLNKNTDNNDKIDEYFNPMPSRDINMQPDIISMSRPDMSMGNFTGDIGIDVNNDGTIDDIDTQEFNNMSSVDDQIKFAREGFMNSTGKDRKGYADLLLRLTGTVNPEELNKNLRAKEKLAFEREKWQAVQSEKVSDNTAKQNLGIAELGLKTKQFEAGVTQQQKASELQQKQFEAGLREREQARELEKLKAQRGYNLERDKLSLLRNKGDLALWETKLKAGENLLGTLIGGGKPTDFASKVGTIGGSIIQNPNLITGGSLSPASYKVMESVGVQGVEPYSLKVATSIGSPQHKSFTQKVSESISGISPEDVMMSNRESVQMQPVSQVIPQQVVQPVIPQQVVMPMVQQVPYQPEMQPSIQAGQYQQNINWSALNPEQVSLFDPQYAKYLDESKGSITYRRGPYKKRRY